MYKNIFYKTKHFVLIFLLFILSSCSDPDYVLVDGSSGKLNDFRGNWLVVNYWADWCPPCIKEMPELSKFYNANKDSVLVLAYNFDRLEGEELSDQIQRFGVDIPSIINGDHCHWRLGGRGRGWSRAEAKGVLRRWKYYYYCILYGCCRGEITWTVHQRHL